MAAFVAAAADLPVAAADGTTEPVVPEGGFDCDDLAQRFAETAGDPARLLVAAATTESADDQELISAAQIDIADAIAACRRGDQAATARFLAAAAAAIGLLEA